MVLRKTGEKVGGLKVHIRPLVLSWLCDGRVESELAALQTRLSQAERLARLEVELAAREAEVRLKVCSGP